MIYIQLLHYKCRLSFFLPIDFKREKVFLKMYIIIITDCIDKTNF